MLAPADNRNASPRLGDNFVYLGFGRHMWPHRRRFDRLELPPKDGHISVRGIVASEADTTLAGCS
jgi:hypothetical protein